MRLRLSPQDEPGIFSPAVPFKGHVLAADNKPLADVLYRNSQEEARLSITMGRDVIELVTEARFLMGNRGRILLNGSSFGTFDSTTCCRLQILDTQGHTVLKEEEDSMTRRFLWAWRNGASKPEADLYARHYFALWIGKGYTLASLFKGQFFPNCLRWRGDYVVMNTADEAVFFEQDTATRLCLLVAACWWACDRAHHAKSLTTYLDASKVAPIPSTLRLDGQQVLMPEKLPARDSKAEFRATHPLPAWLWLLGGLLLALGIIPLSTGEFNGGNLLLALNFSIIPTIWILLSTYLRKQEIRRFGRIEEEMNAAAVSSDHKSRACS